VSLLQARAYNAAFDERNYVEKMSGVNDFFLQTPANPLDSRIAACIFLRR